MATSTTSWVQAILDAASYSFHPFVPNRLGYKRLLALLHPELARIVAKTDAYTLVSARRRVNFYREAQRVLRNNVVGDFVEIGVHRGGTAGVLASLLAKDERRELHLFDRWGDLPEPTAEDGFRQEEFRKDRIRERLQVLQDRPPLADTQRLLHTSIGFPAARTHYYQGWYTETLAPSAGFSRPIAFASIDCDYYESVQLALDFVWRWASPGCGVVIDDYSSWPGTKRAVHEFLRRPDVRAGRTIQLRKFAVGSAALRFALD